MINHANLAVFMRLMKQITQKSMKFIDFIISLESIMFFVEP